MRTISIAACLPTEMSQLRTPSPRRVTAQAVPAVDYTTIRRFRRPVITGHDRSGILAVVDPD